MIDLQTEVSQYTSDIIEGFEEEQFSDIDLYYNDDSIGISVLKDKYLAPWESSPQDMWVRLAWGAAKAEKESERLKYAKLFYSILVDYKFVAGGRINYGLGRDDINVSFSNCYVIPIKDDSLNSIYKAIHQEALTYKTGGGCGHDLSVLRPTGTAIKGTGGESCGPVGFMNLISESTNTVQQQSRRGANMQTILVSHPDIKQFIGIKNDIVKYQKLLEEIARKCPRQIENINELYKFIEQKRTVGHSNISVKLTDEFLKAVENDGVFDLTWNGEVYETIKAKALWDEIIKNAWESAEPGLIFWDRMVETNNLEYINPIISTNPCSEIPLGEYGNCLLGHMNLVRYCVEIDEEYTFDIEAFANDIKIAMRFLDNIITLNDGRHALKEQNEVALNERRTGLGVTGFGDMLLMLKIKYGSKESIDIIDQVMSVFRNSAYTASCELAKEKGSFPWFDKDKFFLSKFAQSLPTDIKNDIKTNGIRNGMLLTCAPVGSGSIIAQTSSGIEPIFRTQYSRKVKNADGITYTTYRVVHPLIKKLFKIEDEDFEFPDYVVDSSVINPEERVSVQGAIQVYIDNSISSTVNLPKEATIKDVGEVYIQAWKYGCKGITVYREGTREGVLLSNDHQSSSFVGDVGELDSVKIYMKRPLKLEGETYKRKVDLNGSPHNCYITVNFFPGTRIPYELLLNEPHLDKEMKDIMLIELATRCTSMMLRHGIPIQFIIEQFSKINNQYLYSVPISISNVLKNYLPTDDNALEICPECGEETLKRENGCYICINDLCQHSKCS